MCAVKQQRDLGLFLQQVQLLEASALLACWPCTCLNAAHTVLSPIVQAVIEIDGPSEFSTNQRLPLGRTVARKCMLEAMGYNVRSIPYYQWVALQQNPDMQRAYLVQLLHTISLQHAQSPQ